MSFRIAVGFFAAILISVALYFVLYQFAPTADGRNGIQIIAQGHFDNNQERLCVLYMLTAATVCVFLVPALDCLKFSTTETETVATITIPKHLLKDTEELMEL